MKVFVSSTCYDLIDLRAELYEELRDLGVEAIFSDLPLSDFRVPTDPTVNSIEACLVNVRASDLMIVILSQRYGPRLPVPFPRISATHCEYREAKDLHKPIRFYVRTQLEAEHSLWRAARRKQNQTQEMTQFPTAFVASEHDADGLFSMIEEHRNLVGADGAAAQNNWLTTFRNSVDLRAAIRRDLATDAYRASGEKLARAGQVPILVVQRQLVSYQEHRNDDHEVYFKFTILNVGYVPAINVNGQLDIGVAQLGGPPADIAAIIPGDDSNVVSFSIRQKLLNQLLAPTERNITARLLLGYSTPSGHYMQDTSHIHMRVLDDGLEYTGKPLFLGKQITGMNNLILDSKAGLKAIITGEGISLSIHRPAPS